MTAVLGLPEHVAIMGGVAETVKTVGAPQLLFSFDSATEPGEGKSTHSRTACVPATEVQPPEVKLLLLFVFTSPSSTSTNVS